MIKASFINSLPNACFNLPPLRRPQRQVCFVCVCVTVSSPPTPPFTYDPLKTDDLTVYGLVFVSWVSSCVCDKDCCPISQIIGLKLFKLKR